MAQGHDHDYDIIRYTDPALPLAWETDKALRCGETTLLTPRWHEQLELKLILAGSAEIGCGPRVFVAQAGDIVIINSCELHSIRPLEEGVRYHQLILTPGALYNDALAAQLAAVMDGRLLFCDHIREDAVCRQLFCAVVAELTGGDAGCRNNDPGAAGAAGNSRALAATGWLSLLLARLMTRHIADVSAAAQQRDVRRWAKTLEPALQHIGAGYAGPLRLEELAALCDVSLYHFCRIFKLVTGKTAIAFINELRINRAQLLLRSTDLPVASIAEAVGFEDCSYFCRCFKRIKGVTPGSCRPAAESKTI